MAHRDQTAVPQSTQSDMPEALQAHPYAWQVITHLGSASLLLPVMAIVAIALWRAGQRAALRVWLLAFAVAVALTLATKIAFLGWGLGIATLDFTGISGHTLLACSVLPLLFGWLLAGERRFSATGAGLGLLAGGLVGASRFALDTHSVSEVVVAWLFGLAVCSLSLRALEATAQRPWFARLSPLLLLLSFNATASTYLPSHEFEIRIALLLSGRDRHYTRQQSLQPEPGRSQALIGVGHWATLAQ